MIDNKSQILKMDDDAWEKGFIDGEAGHSRCPFSAVTREAWSWSSGWIEGDAKRRGFSYSYPTQRIMAA
jgi:ribosome modulation factor